MYICTNASGFGGTFGAKMDSILKQATSITIASAYTSTDALHKYKHHFARIARSGGDVTLLVGMALFEGLHQSTYDLLSEINDQLLSISPSSGSVRVIWHPSCFHGKMYRLQSSKNTVYFAGSSNFSQAGLTDNLEFMTQITDKTAIGETEEYLRWLLEDERSVNIKNCKPFPIIEKASIPRRKLAIKKKVAKVVPKGALYVDISLSRIDKQKGSSLNCFFGKGRWSRATGIVTPRDWFEVEIIVDQETTRHPAYPKGNFTAHTDDGRVFPCRTQGDYYKNLRSKGDLKILGRWIKGKLQQSGALRPYERVTSNTLKDYGRDYIRLHELSDSDYFMEF